MKDLSMFKKLVIGFCAVFMTSIAVGSFGIFGMQRISAADKNLYTFNLLAVDAVGSIMENYANQRSANRDYVLYDSTSDKFKAADDNMKKLESEMEIYIVDYMATIVEKSDAAQFKQFTDSYYGDFKNLKNQLYQLGLDNEQEQAQTLLNTIGEQIAGKITDILNECHRYNMQASKDAVASNKSLFHRMWIIVAILLVINMLVSFFFEFYIAELTAKPAMFMKDMLRRIGTEGNLKFSDEEYKTAEQYAAAKDEIGQSVDMMLTMTRRLVKVGSALETVAGGDLTTQLDLLSEHDTMGCSLQKMTDGLNEMFGVVHSSTVQVAAGARLLSDSSQELSQGSSEQAAAVEQLSSSITEVSGKTKDIADMAHKASLFAKSIKGGAENGNRHMDAMLAAVQEINNSSQNINKVIKVIEDIAFQTNILALNAAIEAAHAGQQGKGFAVVAEEVRNLASKSAEAAKETGGLVAASIEKAELGAQIASETSASLAEIVASINESTSFIVEIAKSSEEQSSAIAQISDGVNQVASVVQQNSATCEESAAASEEMSGQADTLEGLISQFKLRDTDINRTTL